MEIHKTATPDEVRRELKAPDGRSSSPPALRLMRRIAARGGRTQEGAASVEHDGAPEATEAELMRRAQRGDAVAFERLLARYDAALRTLATVSKVPRAHGEDVLQEVRLKLWRSAAAFDARRGTVAAWVFSVAHHCFVDHRRVARRQRRLLETLARERPQAPSLEDAAVRRETLARLRAAFATLDAPSLAVVECALADASHAEIAAALGLPLGTVKTRFARAVTHAREALANAESTRAA